MVPTVVPTVVLILQSLEESATLPAAFQLWSHEDKAKEVLTAADFDQSLTEPSHSVTR